MSSPCWILSLSLHLKETPENEVAGGIKETRKTVGDACYLAVCTMEQLRESLYISMVLNSAFQIFKSCLQELTVSEDLFVFLGPYLYVRSREVFYQEQAQTHIFNISGAQKSIRHEEQMFKSQFF